jgi:hypothetical protein
MLKRTLSRAASQLLDVFQKLLWVLVELFETDHGRRGSRAPW